jgi:hypothetical protein
MIMVMAVGEKKTNGGGGISLFNNWNIHFSAGISL